MSRKQVTIREVAALAETSISTVSKYLNSRPYVSEQARERVAAAIKALEYVPNHSARSLVRGQSGIVGVLIPSFQNPYQSDLLDGMNSSAAMLGIKLLVATSGNASKSDNHMLTGLLNSGVDGIIMTSAHMTDRNLIKPIAARIPVVLAGRHIDDEEIDYVVIDNCTGGKLAASHLAKLGHQQIAYIDGPSDIVDFSERRAGFMRQLQEYRLELDEKLVFSGSPTSDFGRSITRAVMSRRKSARPTAIFAAADWIAIGALAEARALGIKVPDDLSVIGFDNVSLWHLSGTPLTTIDAQPSKVGQRALTLLMRRIQGDVRPSFHERLKPTLVIRASTARINGLYH